LRKPTGGLPCAGESGAWYIGVPEVGPQVKVCVAWIRTTPRQTGLILRQGGGMTVVMRNHIVVQTADVKDRQAGLHGGLRIRGKKPPLFRGVLIDAQVDLEHSLDVGNTSGHVHQGTVAKSAHDV
jgi:hypothetical protein